jgi:hypothetical protein
LFLTGPWGRIAGVLGKRWVLLLNLSSTTFASLWFAGVCKLFLTTSIENSSDDETVYFQLPVQMVYITPFFDIIGGGTVIMSSFIYGFIAEAVEPKYLLVRGRFTSDPN